MTAVEVWASPLSTGEMATRPVSRFRTRLFPLELEPALPQVSNEDLKNGKDGDGPERAATLFLSGITSVVNRWENSC